MIVKKIILALLILLTSTVLWASPKIKIDEARAIAIKAVDIEEVGPITDIGMEDEEGILVFAVEFTKDGIETDVKIDAQTGEIVKIESDLTETEEEAEDK